MYDYDKLVQRIKKNKDVLLYLKLFYMDEIYEESFMDKLTDCCCKCHVSEEEAFAMYFASRIPGENCRDRIMRKIEEIEAKENSK